MQRLFGIIENNIVKLSNEDLHHLFDVKRYKVGEKLEVVFKEKVFLCEIKSSNPREIICLNEINNTHEIKSKVKIGFVLLKGDHNSLIVEKCTEIGCNSFYPIVSDRCVIKADLDNDNNRIDRLKKVIKGASEQSRRDVIPFINQTLSFKDFLDVPCQNKVIAYEGLAGSSKTFLSYLNENSNIDELLILIGPEGGFTQKEVDLSLQAGFVPVSLGKTILRGETAAIYASTLACSFLGEIHE